MKKKKSDGQQKFKQELYKKLVKYFDKHVNEEITIHDLGEYCHVGRHNFPILKDVLSWLITEQHITRKRGGLYIREAKENLVVGKMRVSDKGAGFVQIEGADEEIFIRPADKNMAFNKDKVVVEVLATTKGRLREGKIIAVEERAYNQFPGIYHKTRYYSYAAPIDRRMNKEFLIPPEDSMDAEDGQVVIFELKEWPENELNPIGKVIKILGSQDDPGIDIETLIVSYGVGAEFSAEVMEEAEQKQLALTQEVMDNRLDLREMVTFTIDPDDAKDFDDAVSLDFLDNGNWYLGVHIADVSHFVPERSELDISAHERACSVYLVDRVIPMLPEFLSNGLCSLKPNEDRLSFSCFMEIDPSGDLVSYEIKPSVINSNKRYNYDEVQAILDDPKNNDEFSELLKKMWGLGKFLNKKRIASGAMDFETPEVKFVLDDKGFPIDIIPKVRLNSMRLIEEFMLMANKTVALHIERIAEKRILLPFLYRVHEKPSTEKVDRFVEFMKALGYSIRGENLHDVKNFQGVLQSVHGTPELNLIEEIALRSMMKAMYATNNIGHFGLGFDHYTHFTSPIRRYPDLWVHRLLKEYDQMVGKSRISALKNILKDVCNQSNAREINAQQAERDSIKLKQIEYISQYVGEEFEGLVSGVMEFGLFIELKDNLIEGLVHIRDLEDDYYVYDEGAMSLTGRHHKHRYRLGDPVKIKVIAVNKENRNIDFILVHAEERPPIRKRKEFSKNAKNAKKKVTSKDSSSVKKKTSNRGSSAGRKRPSKNN